MLKGKRVLIGVTGGIAIYKVLDLISRLKKMECDVEVIMTEGACAFIQPLTFQTMGRCKVYTDQFKPENVEEVDHIALTERADVFLIAPATANTIAKVRHGIADNLLTSTVVASVAPMVFATAMNSNMLANPITQDNIQDLQKLGYRFIDAETGFLACNYVGKGRLAEPEQIIEYLENFFTKKDLKGKKILISAGPTRERIDPVRYLTNDSSGKMGYSIAKQASLRGADVVLVSGPTALSPPIGVQIISIQSTEELLSALSERFDDCDGLIMAAAPSDYRVAQVKAQKMKKTNEPLVLELVENPDILMTLSQRKTDQILIGFSAETENLLKNASDKRIRKGLDYIVANDVTLPGAGFNVDTNIATIIGEKGESSYELMTKRELADIILDLLIEEGPTCL